jgi:alpha-tubulin suppressor-like RCC1 family protein
VGDTANLTGIAQISAGNDHSCAVSSAGSAYCWGRNVSGPLGDGTTVNPATLAAVQVKSPDGSGYLTNVTSISAGRGAGLGRLTCAIVSGGSAYCWGLNTNSQLGNGLSASSSLPVQVRAPDDSGPLTGVRAISPGSDHTCATTSAGVFCWGAGTSNRLGSGSTTKRTLPFQIGDPASDASSAGVSVGELMGCYTADGNIKCWGAQSYGELGIGLIGSFATPYAIRSVR